MMDFETSKDIIADSLSFSRHFNTIYLSSVFQIGDLLFKKFGKYCILKDEHDEKYKC